MRSAQLPYLMVLFLAWSATSADAKSGGDYTGAQAQRGATVYAQSCAECHGTKLQGESGPELRDQTFRNSYGGGTAAPLYDFISRQMPQNAPASLSRAQYLDVTAYILSRNGYPSGTTSLTTGSLPQVHLSAKPSGDMAKSGTDEIVRAAAPVRHVYAAFPEGANVSVTDAMMQNAASDDKNWLLHGRTYDNQRYSPLTQITAANVKSLSLVALVQTGMTASFETTPIVVNGVMYITTPVVNHKMIIMAVNASTGERLWDVTYNLGAFQICCGPVNRGVAVGYGKVYVVTLDDHLLALDASDGQTVWDTTIVSSKNGSRSMRSWVS